LKLVLIPLFILILIAVTVQFFNFAPIFSGGNYAYNSGVTSGTGQVGIVFTVGLSVGFLSLFGSAVIIGILSGLDISIFGSTVQISERSQKLIYHILFYGGLWGIFSVLSTIGINGLSLFAIPLWGILFYLILTLVYVLGVNQQIESTG
jgi:hypothetical protein